MASTFLGLWPSIFAEVDHGFPAKPASQDFANFRFCGRIVSAHEQIVLAWNKGRVQNPVFRGLMKVALYPLIGILRVGALAFNLAPFSQEAGAILSGFTVTGLLGMLYLSVPLTLARTRISAKKSRSLKRLEMRSLYALVFAVFVVGLADLLGVQTLIVVDSASAVLLMLFVSGLWVSRGFRWALFHLLV